MHGRWMIRKYMTDLQIPFNTKQVLFKYYRYENTPVDYITARSVIEKYNLPDFGKATIREVVAISSELEEVAGTEFIHMEMGVPGLPPPARSV